jgi:hypothetical protein
MRIFTAGRAWLAAGLWLRAVNGDAVNGYAVTFNEGFEGDATNKNIAVFAVNGTTATPHTFKWTTNNTDFQVISIRLIVFHKDKNTPEILASGEDNGNNISPSATPATTTAASPGITGVEIPPTTNTVPNIGSAHPTTALQKMSGSDDHPQDVGTGQQNGNGVSSVGQRTAVNLIGETEWA